MSPINTNLIIIFGSLFNEEPLEISEYLRSYDKKTMLTSGSFLLSFKNRNSRFDDFRELLSIWFCRENQPFVREIYPKLVEFEKKHGKLLIINPESSLQLFEFCFENLPDEVPEFSKQDFEINLFKAYLVLNQKNIEKENLFISSVNTVTDDKKIIALLLGQIVSSDLINYNLADTTICQFIKANYLFRFLSSNVQTIEHLKAFLEYYNSPSWVEYLKSFLPIAFTHAGKSEESHTDITVEKNEHFLQSCMFLDKHIVNPDDDIRDEDYRFLRAKPMYKISENTYRIIFNLFVSEKIYNGMYFQLNKINSLLPNNLKIKNFRSFYCDDFTEQILFYSILKKAFNSRYIEYSGNEIKTRGYISEPDYYVRNGNYLFLFESKDVLIDAATKHSHNYAEIENKISEKLYSHTNEKGKEDKKAILQLLYNVRRVLLNEFSFDRNYKAKNVNIYPVIVVYTQVLNIVGINQLLNLWFSEELEKLKDEGLPIDRVRQVILVDIDTLICCQDHLASKAIKLNDLIDGYISRTTFDKKKRFKDEAHKVNYVKSLYIPFSIYVANECSNKKLQSIPKDFSDMGLGLFNTPSV